MLITHLEKLGDMDIEILDNIMCDMCNVDMGDDIVNAEGVSLTIQLYGSSEALYNKDLCDVCYDKIKPLIGV